MKTKWYDNKKIVVALLIFFFPVGLLALWKSNNFTRAGKIVWSVAIALFTLIVMANKATITQEFSPKIHVLIQKASVSKDRLRDTKITYNVTLSKDDISSISEKEAQELLSAIFFADADHKCCEKAFINLSPTEVDTPYFLSGQEENGKFTIRPSGFSWESLTCGLNIAADSRDEIRQKVRGLRNETGQLANEFISAYESGQTIDEYPIKARQILDQWNDFTRKTFIKDKKYCESMMYYPEANAKISAIILLDSIEGAGGNPSFRLDKDAFIKSYQMMIAQQI